MTNRRPLNILDDAEDDDPILSVVNIVDVFLVIIAVLLIAIIQNPLNPFTGTDVVVIKNPGDADMEIIIRSGEKLEHYRASGELGEGAGSRAGVAYRMEDGSMVYVPETETAQ